MINGDSKCADRKSRNYVLQRSKHTKKHRVPSGLATIKL